MSIEDASATGTSEVISAGAAGAELEALSSATKRKKRKVEHEKEVDA